MFNYIKVGVSGHLTLACLIWLELEAFLKSPPKADLLIFGMTNVKKFVLVKMLKNGIL